MKADIIVIGAGAAGMMAAITAAKNGKQVLLLERNEKPGKKLYITGKGRCNITNACEVEDLFLNVPRNNKFLYSAFYSFTNAQVIEFFESAGVATKVERGMRVFPVSDHSSDVIKALKNTMDELQVKVKYYARVKELLIAENRVIGVIMEDGEKIHASHVIVATGGKSYASTGSSGDGYYFAKIAGHTITELAPSLVPFTTEETYVKEMQGLALKNVKASIYNGKKELYSDFGEMLFTHFGVSGPLMLSASAIVNDQIKKGPLDLRIDLKPALTEEQLDKRILREFEENQNRQFKNVVGKLVPSKMIPVLINLCGIDEETKINSISKEDRSRLLNTLKAFPVTLNGLRDFNEAIITRGGISVKEVNPSTMESKLVQGLYFAGEVLDLDAYTGGFNLQIAWSTGYLAGLSAASECV